MSLPQAIGRLECESLAICLSRDISLTYSTGTPLEGAEMPIEWSKNYSKWIQAAPFGRQDDREQRNE
jgi:hypothetical protein